MERELELTLGELLRIMRERAGLQQSGLAERLEMGRTSVIRYESGAAVPKWKDAALWATECGYAPEVVRSAWETAKQS